MNRISYSESPFLLCACTTPTISVSLVPVPWIYIPFFCQWHIFISVVVSSLSCRLHTWLFFFLLLATISCFLKSQMSTTEFWFFSFQFSSPKFPHLGKWCHHLPNLSQCNIWSHLWLPSVSHSCRFNPLDVSITCVPPSISTISTWIYHVISPGELQNSLIRFLLLPLPHTTNVTQWKYNQIILFFST